GLAIGLPIVAAPRSAGHPLQRFIRRLERAGFENLVLEAADDPLACCFGLPLWRQDNADALESRTHSHPDPALIDPDLILIGDHLESPVVADQGCGVAVSYRLPASAAVGREFEPSTEVDGRRPRCLHR